MYLQYDFAMYSFFFLRGGGKNFLIFTVLKMYMNNKYKMCTNPQVTQNNMNSNNMRNK